MPFVAELLVVAVNQVYLFNPKVRGAGTNMGFKVIHALAYTARFEAKLSS